MIPRTTRRVAVGTTLLVAVAVRAWGVRFGLPDVQARPDEIATVGVAMGFLDHLWWPGFFDYPRLLMYVYALLFAAYGVIGAVVGWVSSYSEFVRGWKANWAPLFLIGRWVSVVTGTATVWLVYQIGRRRAGDTAALVSSICLALAFLHVRDSHYATTDVPMTCLAWLAIALVLAAYDSCSQATLRWAAVMAALASATKYSSALLALPVSLVVALWLLERRVTIRKAIGELALLAALMAGVFLVLSPYIIVDYLRFKNAMDLLQDVYKKGMMTAEPLGGGWFYHVRVSLRYGLGLPLLLASVVGTIMMARRWPRWTLILASFPVGYYVATGGGRMVFVRYMVPVLPFLCLAAGVLVDRATLWLKSPRARTMGAAAVTALLLVPSVRSVVLFDRLMGRSDTRAEAAGWFRDHAQGAAIIAQSGSEYGRVQFWWGHPCRLWWMDPASGAFIERPLRFVEGTPDYIVVQESALPYSYVLPQMRALLDRRYELVQTFRAGDSHDARNVYDLQDAFFVPYAGFHGVERPGPNLYIWRLAR